MRKEWLVKATLVIRLLHDCDVDAYERAQQTLKQTAVQYRVTAAAPPGVTVLTRATFAI